MTHLSNAAMAAADMQRPIGILANLVAAGIYPSNIGELISDITKMPEPFIQAISNTQTTFSNTSRTLSNTERSWVISDNLYHSKGVSDR